MDRSAVAAIAERHLHILRNRLGLSHWEIGLGYSPELTRDDGSLSRGECTRLVDYQSAHISLNPEAFDHEADVLATLRHELFHVVLSPFDLYTSAVERLNISDEAVEILERIREHAIEQAVSGLERMHAGLISHSE